MNAEGSSKSGQGTWLRPKAYVGLLLQIIPPEDPEAITHAGHVDGVGKARPSIPLLLPPRPPQ